MVDYKKKYLKYKKKYSAIKKLKGGMWTWIKETIKENIENANTYPGEYTQQPGSPPLPVPSECANPSASPPSPKYWHALEGDNDLFYTEETPPPPYYVPFFMGVSEEKSKNRDKKLLQRDIMKYLKKDYEEKIIDKLKIYYFLHNASPPHQIMDDYKMILEEEYLQEMIPIMEEKVLEYAIKSFTLEDFKEVLHKSLDGKFMLNIDEFLCNYKYNTQWD